MTDGADTNDVRDESKKSARRKSFVVSIGEQVEEAIRQALGSRGNVVMVRVSDEILEYLDMLVESGLFKSRSESAAFLLQAGVKANRKLFGEIQAKIDEIQRLREDLRSIFKNNLT